MKIAMIVLLSISIIVLCSCGRRKEVKEDKITITVERPEGSEQGMPEDKRPAQAKEWSPDDVPPEGPPEDRVNFEEARDILREMVEDDPRIKELIKEKNVFKLTRHLLDEHADEIAKIAKGSKIDNERIVAFQVSRHLVMKEKRKLWEQKQRGASPPRRRGEESFP